MEDRIEKMQEVLKQMTWSGVKRAMRKGSMEKIEGSLCPEVYGQQQILRGLRK